MVQQEPGAIVQEHRVVTGGQRPEERSEWHLLPCHGDLDPQVEPVEVVGVLGAESDHGRLSGTRVFEDLA